MNLIVTVQANLAQFMSGMAQVRTTVQQAQQQFQTTMSLPPTTINSLQTFRSSVTSATLAVGALSAAFSGLAAGAVAAFTSQESAFAGIRKTVNATDEEFARLYENLTALSSRTPVSFEDLSKIGELAGQLGIRGVDNLTKFTETIARIAVSTNLSTEAAAIGFARIAAVMQEPISNIDRMAASVVALGNNFATTESEIITFAERIAGAGKIAGLSTAEVFGLGAAFSSVGVKAESGGTAIQKLLIAMTKAAAVGGDNLRILAKLAGETEQGFQALFKAAPAQAFIQVLKGIQLAGDNAFAALDGLVGEEARFLRAMLSMSNAGDLLARVMAVAGQGFEQNTALLIESNRRFATFESTIKTLRNTILNFAASIGEALMPVLRPLAQVATAIFEAFQAIPAPLKTLYALTLAAVAAIGALTAAIGTGLILFSSLKIGVLAAASALGLATVSLGTIATGIGIVIGVIVGIGLAITAVIKIYQWWTMASKEQRAEVDRLEKNLRAQGKTTETLGDQTKTAAEKAAASQSIWQRFGQGVSRAFSGIAGYAEDAWKALKQGLSDLGSAITEWSPGFTAAWQAAWSGLSGFVSTTFDTILMGIRKYGPAIVDSLTWWIVNPINALLSRGAERQGETAVAARIQQEAADQLRREEQRARSMGQRGQAFRVFDLIDEAEFERQLKQMQANLDSFNEAQSITTAAIKAAVAEGTMTERQSIQASIDMLTQKGMAEEDYFRKASGLASLLNKNSQDKLAELVRAHAKSKTEMAIKEIEFHADLRALDRKEVEDYNKTLFQQIEDADDAYQAIGDLRQEMSRKIQELGKTDAQIALEGFQKERDAVLAVITEKKRLAQTSDAVAQAISAEAEAQDLFNKRIKEFVEKEGRAAHAEFMGLVDSMGLFGIEAVRAAEAWRLVQKAYKDLDPDQRRMVDRSAEITEQTRQEKEMAEALALARVLDTQGIKEQDAIGMVYQAKSMEREQKNLDTYIGILNTRNNYEQVMAQKRGQLLMEQGQDETNFYKFSVGALRKWAAEQDTIWQAYQKLITNTLGAVQRTLSDVFFNYFTGQTFKLKDAFKDMLNAILREIANFMAAAAVKGFIAFLGNLMNGQSPGTAATGAVQSLFGTTSGGGTGTSGGTASGVGGLLSGAGSLFGWLFGGGSTTTGLPSVGTTIPSVTGISYGGGMGTGTSGYTPSSPSSISYYSPPSYTSSLDSSYFDYGSLQYATGGRVPGAGRGDTVPALLEPGEFVVRRSVAEQMGPALEQLNGGGGPGMRGGRLTFAVGGTVPTIEARSVTTDTLLQAILVTLNRQTRATQVIAENTGQSSQTLTSMAQEEGVTTPAWIAPLGLETDQPTGLEGLLNTGLLQGGLRGVGSGVSALGFKGSAQTLSGLAGIATFIQGTQQNNPYLMASGGLTTASALAGILANPEIAAALGLTPGQAAGAGIISQSLSAATGAVGLAQGIQTGNYLTAAQGGLQTLSGISNILSTSQAASLLGYSTGPLISPTTGAFTPTLGGALGAAGGVLGAAAGGLSLYQGIQNEDPTQIALGAASTALGVYGTLSAIAPGTFPALSVLAADALIAIAPATAAALGITGSAGAAAGGTLAGAGGAAGIGAVGAGATAGAALVLAATILLWGDGGLLSKYKGPTSAEISQTVSGIGINQLNQYANSKTGLSDLVQILYSQWAPHGEVQIGSTSFFGGQGDYQTPASENWLKALGALYTPDLVNFQGEGMPWVEEFVRGLTVTYGPTGSATTPDPKLVWKLQSKLAAALPDLSAYQGLKAAVAPGGDLWAAEQTRLAAELAALQAIPTPPVYDIYTGQNYAWQPGMTQNTWDPYTNTGYTPDGRMFQLSEQTIGDYRINPYTYDPYLATYGTPYPGTGYNYAAGGYNWSYGGDTAGISGDSTGTAGDGPGIGSAGEGMARGGWVPGIAWQGGGGWNYATGGWVNGRLWGRDSVRARLSPGEFVVPSRIAAGHTDRLEQLAASGQWAGGNGNGPMNISITINGDVTDPRETAKHLGAAIRDELRRIEPRYSRAGNKTQG